MTKTIPAKLKDISALQEKSHTIEEKIEALVALLGGSEGICKQGYLHALDSCIYQIYIHIDNAYPEGLMETMNRMRENGKA